jgi:hypothetical protein
MTSRQIGVAHRRYTENPNDCEQSLGFGFSGFVTGLPARFLAPTAAATSATTAASAATTPSATTAAAEAATAAEAAATWRHRPGLVHRKRSAAEAVLVQFGDGILRVLVRRHFNEREAPAAAGLAIFRDTHRRHLASLCEQRCEVVLINVIGKVPDIQFVAHDHSAHQSMLYGNSALGAECSGLAGAGGMRRSAAGRLLPDGVQYIRDLGEL